MSKHLDGVLNFCTQHRHTFPMIAKLGRSGSEAARATGISGVWRRVPITTVTIALVIGFWLYDYVSVLSAADAGTPRSGVAVAGAPDVSFTPPPVMALSGSHPSEPLTKTGRSLDAKPTHSAFRRKQVGLNEVDYVAEDVTIRLFTPGRMPTPAAHLSRQVHFGRDVTVRYFDNQAALTPQRGHESAAQSVDHSSLVSK